MCRLINTVGIDHSFVTERCLDYDRVAVHVATVDAYGLLAATGLDPQLVRRVIDHINNIRSDHRVLGDRVSASPSLRLA